MSKLVVRIVNGLPTESTNGSPESVKEPEGDVLEIYKFLRSHYGKRGQT